MFVPRRIIFEKDVLNYSMAKRVMEQFKDYKDIEIIHLDNNRFAQYIPGKNLYTQFREGKKH